MSKENWFSDVLDEKLGHIIKIGEVRPYICCAFPNPGFGDRRSSIGENSLKVHLVAITQRSGQEKEVNDTFNISGIENS